jgi:hypothetical protein
MPVIKDSDDSIRAPLRLASTTLQRSGLPFLSKTNAASPGTLVR